MWLLQGRYCREGTISWRDRRSLNLHNLSCPANVCDSLMHSCFKTLAVQLFHACSRVRTRMKFVKSILVAWLEQGSLLASGRKSCDIGIWGQSPFALNLIQSNTSLQISIYYWNLRQGESTRQEISKIWKKVCGEQESLSYCDLASSYFGTPRIRTTWNGELAFVDGHIMSYQRYESHGVLRPWFNTRPQCLCLSLLDCSPGSLVVKAMYCGEDATGTEISEKSEWTRTMKWVESRLYNSLEFVVCKS